MDSTNVLVVGAGPAGLALACGLREHDVPVRVIDQAAGPATTSRANILHGRGVEVLNRLGALGDLSDRAQHAISISYYVADKRLATVSFGKIEGKQLSALLVSQAEIEAVLRQRLAELGCNVEWGRELTGLAQQPDGVTATLQDGELHADYLAGCDGAHSTVRKLSGIDFPGVPLIDQWLLADVRVDWDLDRTGSSGWFHRDGLFFAMPMRSAENDTWRLMADVRPTDGEQPDVVDQLQQLLPERTGRTDAKIRDVAWTSTFRIHRRLADRYREGRVLLVGDAAHIHSPFGGQGMNTGIGDAENLAWKLALVAQGRADAALLDTYQAERRPLAEDVVRNTTANTKLMLADGPVARIVRDRLITPLVNLKVVQRRVTWIASQLWVTYRKGPLGSGKGPRPRPGDRVPDLDCRDDRGRPTRLHTELGGKWALLAPTATGLETLAPLGEHVVHLTPDQPRQESWLIRPDAHLAWRGTDQRALARWLDEFRSNGRTT
ncbi:FAD-dependent monooxygenase [Saccharopolyspora sp. K220]|uniref:FAD-dependent monooxygenase n=1 Tax=Saccharopolyspora soli TaxID=2926618 RepID=UPI001F57DC5B|nr:FAD-dependent monooxygenase [Saccharopolyspora soli]MCI2419004.1 FAD-dependent monooxygenase [Saccharopolyspora soli]